MTRFRSILCAAVFGLLAGAGGARAASASYFLALPPGGATELQAPRYGSVAAPLPDGDVLIAGGADSSFMPVATAELFHPASDTFTALSGPNATLDTPRLHAAAAPLPDGKVLIVGGSDGMHTLSSAELFDPATASFISLIGPSSHLSTPRGLEIAAPLPDGKVLIAGGGTGAGARSAELYDPNTFTFTALPASGQTELQEPLSGAVAAPLPDGKVLIAGGNDNGVDTQDAELFDPATNTFTMLTGPGRRLTAIRSGMVAAPLPDGKVLIAAGDLNSAELFDPATDTFTAIAATVAPQAVTAPVAAALSDGRVLIAGGTPIADMQHAELFEPAPEAVIAGGSFGDQILSERSGAQTLLVTNLGVQALVVSGAGLTGTQASDFTVLADGCAGRRLAFEQSCTIETGFTPSRIGVRSARLTLNDNSPTSESTLLSGVGVKLPAGPAGKPGPRGEIELVTCRTVTVKRGKHRVKREKCVAKLVSGVVRFTTAAPDRATLTRGGILYATGTVSPSGVRLVALRRLVPGLYTLTVRHHAAIVRLTPV